MNVNINNKNLFSQSLLINKFFFQKNSSHKQTGITTVDSGCQYRKTIITIIKMVYLFYQRNRQTVVSMVRIGKR